jgi:hypothetical protein
MYASHSCCNASTSSLPPRISFPMSIPLHFTPPSSPTPDAANSRFSHESRSFRHSSTQHLRSEEPTFRPLNDLLIHGLRRVVHDNRSSLVVYLCVYTRIANEIDDPFLAFVLREAETS